MKVKNKNPTNLYSLVIQLLIISNWWNLTKNVMMSPWEVMPRRGLKNQVRMGQRNLGLSART